ncbi:hypothetical protein KY285_012594 [Solanum tuberosum]|nr:hypothetical protein KY285_012594 [Solanum tuberosum]
MSSVSDPSFPLFLHAKNHQLLQTLATMEAGVDWIIHLDTDELMHPAGTSEYLYGDFWQIYLKMLTWSYFLTISRCSRRIMTHLTKEMYFGNYKEATRGNPNYFLTYGNGKSAARVQGHMRSNGAHRWHNYMKSPKYFAWFLRFYACLGVFSRVS